MKIHRHLIAALLVGVFSCPFAQAQETQPKVGTVDAVRVLNDMQETRDLKQKLENDRAALIGEGQKKEENIKNLRQQRDMLRTDHPQYAEKQKQVMEAELEFRVWNEFMQADYQRRQKLQIVTLFHKVEGAIKEVAEQKQLDLVLSKQSAELPENLDKVSFEQVKEWMYQRSLLFAAERLDITNEVIASLDARYKAAPPAASQQ